MLPRMRRVVVHRGRVVNERGGFGACWARAAGFQAFSYSTDSFDLDRLAAELACENFQVLRLREDVHFLAVGTASGQFALRVESRCFPGFAHDLDFLTAMRVAATLL